MLKNAGRFLIIALSVMLITASVPFQSAAGAKQDRQQPVKPNGGISFNFVDVEIPTVIKFISELTGYNFIFDERIRGKITIVAPTQLSVEESFSLFTSVLSLKGFTIVPSGSKSFKIIPSSMAKQEGIITTEETVPVNEGYITRLIPAEHIKAEDTLQFLRPIVSRDGHISAFGPRNLLLVVDSAVNIDKILSILKLIDKPYVKEEEAKINVYFLEHADATELAKVLQGILKDLQTAMRAVPKAQPEGVKNATPLLSVTPDQSTNSLIIVAPPSDYENLVEVIRTLDKKRKQVYVEAMIVEATIEKLQELGSKWRGIARSQGEPVSIGGFGNISSGTVLDIITGLTGFSAGGMGNFLDIPITSIGADGTVTTQNLTAPGFAALFSLNEFKNAVNVLSTPQILTSDNKEAEILVGENVPFISQRERDVTTTNTVLNSIERTDVGIKLKITPQITEGNYVKLDIFQEISAVKDTPADVLTTVGPTTTKRSTKTTVVVQDGRTVVIGGLMQEREEEGVSKMPLLGDIPVLGWFFKFKNTTKNKTNLLVFLSPHVVKESPQLAKITQDKKKNFVTQEKFYALGELLVRFRDDVPDDRALEIIAQHGASLIEHFKGIHLYHIGLKRGQDVEAAVKEFSSLTEVLYAEPNYKISIHDTPPENGEAPGAAEPPRTGEKQGQPDAGVVKQASPQPSGKEENVPQPDVPDTSGLTGEGTGTVAPVQETVEPSVPERKVITPEAEMSGSDVRQGSPPAGEDRYLIQVGAWKNPEYAFDTLEKLKSRYPEAYIVRGKTFHKLQIPGIRSKAQGALIIQDIKDTYRLNPILIRDPQ